MFKNLKIFLSLFKNFVDLKKIVIFNFFIKFNIWSKSFDLSFKKDIPYFKMSLPN